MATTSPPPHKAPPPPPARGNRTPPSNTATVPSKNFTIQRGKTLAFHKTVIYGPGGVGKSELCSLLAKVGVRPLMLDLDMETEHLDVARVQIGPFEELRSAVQDTKFLDPFDAVVVDSLTKAEEMAVSWTLANVKHEKGHYVDSIEGYGFGKGFTHVYETFLKLLCDLDAIVRAGKHVVCTAHDCTTTVPNPMGEDWIRWEPRLQHPSSGKSSIRLRVKEWATHLLYIGYDQNVDENGKAEGSGTRTIYPRELPSHLAKSRTLSEPIPYKKDDPELWKKLFSKEN